MNFPLSHLLIAALLSGCATSAAPKKSTAALPSPSVVTALVGVNVLPMTEDRVLLRQTIVIENGLIRRLGSSSEVEVPKGAQVIDGEGQFVIPGFVDMHVHLSDDAGENARILDLSLAHGITTIRGTQGANEQLSLRASLRASDALAPRLLLAGPMIARTLTAEEARTTVREQKAAGYDFIKIIGGFDLPAYDTLVETAKEERIPLIGHLPKEIPLAHALAAHQMSIEHLMGYMKAPPGDGPDGLNTLAKQTAAAGVTNCPTLDWMVVGGEGDVARLLARDGVAFAPKPEVEGWKKWRAENAPNAADVTVRANRAVVTLVHHGARVVVGSDAPGEFRVPGFAFDEEMRDLRKAGLSTFEVLRAATESAAESLGDRSFGTVMEGMRADLVVVHEDPTANLETIVRPVGVMVAGRWLSAHDLEARMEKHRAR